MNSGLRRTSSIAIFLAVFWLPGPSLCAPEPEPGENYQITTHITLPEALEKLFPGADVERQVVALNPEQAARVGKRTGHPLQQTEFEVYLGKKGGELLGYAMVDEEIGKYRPITSLIGVDAKGRVMDVLILVYRESRGGEVSRPRFRRQYHGKTNKDAIRVWRDIISIAGATLSVRAVSTQVRKVLAIVQEVFLNNQEVR